MILSEESYTRLLLVKLTSIVTYFSYITIDYETIKKRIQCQLSQMTNQTAIADIYSAMMALEHPITYSITHKDTEPHLFTLLDIHYILANDTLRPLTQKDWIYAVCNTVRYDDIPCIYDISDLLLAIAIPHPKSNIDSERYKNYVQTIPLNERRAILDALTQNFEKLTTEMFLQEAIGTLSDKPFWSHLQIYLPTPSSNIAQVKQTKMERKTIAELYQMIGNVLTTNTHPVVPHHTRLYFSNASSAREIMFKIDDPSSNEDGMSGLTVKWDQTRTALAIGRRKPGGWENELTISVPAPTTIVTADAYVYGQKFLISYAGKHVSGNLNFPVSYILTNGSAGVVPSFLGQYHNTNACELDKVIGLQPRRTFPLITSPLIFETPQSEATWTYFTHAKVSDMQAEMAKLDELFGIQLFPNYSLLTPQEMVTMVRSVASATYTNITMHPTTQNDTVSLPKHICFSSRTVRHIIYHTPTRTTWIDFNRTTPKLTVNAGTGTELSYVTIIMRNGDVLPCLNFFSGTVIDDPATYVASYDQINAFVFPRFSSSTYERQPGTYVSYDEQINALTSQINQMSNSIYELSRKTDDLTVHLDRTIQDLNRLTATNKKEHDDINVEIEKLKNSVIIEAGGELTNATLIQMVNALEDRVSKLEVELPQIVNPLEIRIEACESDVSRHNLQMGEQATTMSSLKQAQDEQVRFNGAVTTNYIDIQTTIETMQGDVRANNQATSKLADRVILCESRLTKLEQHTPQVVKGDVSALTLIPTSPEVVGSKTQFFRTTRSFRSNDGEFTYKTNLMSDGTHHVVEYNGANPVTLAGKLFSYAPRMSVKESEKIYGVLNLPSV
jgi:hypothetical protein